MFSRHPRSEVEIKHEITMLTKIHATVRALGSFTLYPWSKRAVLWKSFMGPTIPRNAHTIQVGVNYMMIDFVFFFWRVDFFLVEFPMRRFHTKWPATKQLVGYCYGECFLNIVLLCWLLLPGEFPCMGRCPNARNHHWSTNPLVTYWFPSIRPAIKP